MMKDKFTTLIAAAAVAAMALTVAPIAQADEWNKKTNLTVNETIEIPGATLKPGKYVMKLVDSLSNRNIVQFLNEREDQVISTVIAVPNLRLKPKGDTEFGWYETPANEAPVMRAWFYPGDTFGQEFVYSERRGRQLARATGRNIPSVADTQREKMAMRTSPEEPVDVTFMDVDIVALTPEDERKDIETAVTENEALDRDRPMTRTAKVSSRSEPNSETTQVAQAQPQPTPQTRMNTEAPRSPQPAPSYESTEELPETAGPAPLIALLGLISLGAAAAVRKIRS